MAITAKRYHEIVNKAKSDLTTYNKSVNLNPPSNADVLIFAQMRYVEESSLEVIKDNTKTNVTLIAHLKIKFGSVETYLKEILKKVK